jgi:cytochrome c peroxidase/dsDNA-binding SOS-regulon protein
MTLVKSMVVTNRSAKGLMIQSVRQLLLPGLLIGTLASCQMPKPEPPDPQAALIAKGRQLFFNETFDGNGRTCGTCHRAEDNFAISPAFIATLPADDPLFVAETNPNLAANFENPRLMREFGLIVENLDGFGDLENVFTLRGVPHTLALNTSIDSAQGPRTGWSGDGAPGDGSLRAFATGAVIQHFPKSLGRVVGNDFRLPTEAELDALEAFQLSLGRQEDPELPLPLKGVVAARGQEIFLDNTLGKCNACHFNAGANGDPQIFGPDAGNLNFDTGVENLPDQPADLTGELVPADDGLGIPGDGSFNTPPLIEAADTGPFFHNNSIETIEGAVAFYNGDAFNNSPAGQLLVAATGSGINLDGTQVVAVSAFLRAINALENIRRIDELLQQSREETRQEARESLRLALAETDDAISVLAGGGLHADAVNDLRKARRLTRKARRSFFSRSRLTEQALRELEQARIELVKPSDNDVAKAGGKS